MADKENKKNKKKNQEQEQEPDPEARVGDQVTVLGDGKDGAPSACDLAGQLGTIAYEILCSINKRIPRIYLDGKKRTEILQYIV